MMGSKGINNMPSQQLAERAYQPVDSNNETPMRFNNQVE